ncbi:hypothetical protein C8J57DRAFT_1483242 [Mycena rebaudengoi]|nr:hypothetical protein C8J57DRAFT_1483242 [Mycena rebaudengoi]
MGEDSTPPSKRNKSSPTVSNPLNQGESSSTTSRLEVAVNPPGLIWDSANFGCAYDSLFVPLSFVLRDNPVIWSTKMSDMHPILGVWVLTLQQSAIPELARDSVRCILHHQAPNSFLLGRRGLQLDVLWLLQIESLTPAQSHLAESVTPLHLVKYGSNGLGTVTNPLPTFEATEGTVTGTVAPLSNRKIHTAKWFSWNVVYVNIVAQKA